MNKQSYSRTLKLGPAIGDWTKIKFQDPSLNEVEISEVKNVNFDSLPRDDMKTLHLLHYRLAEKIADKVANDLDIKVELHTITAQQMTYQEFMESQTEKIVQADYLVDNLGRVNVLFDWELADMIVNRLTGGKGEQTQDYHFTDIEVTILESQMETLRDEFAASWNHAFTADQLDMKFSYGPYVYDKKFSLREAYIVFTFHLYFGKGNLTKVSWAYPNDVLRYLLSNHRTNPKPVEKKISLSDTTLSGIKVPVKAELGKASLKMGDLKSLQKGDIIPLNTFFDKPLEFNIGSSVSLQSQPGVHNEHIGLQLILPDTDHFNASAVTVLPQAVITETPAQIDDVMSTVAQDDSSDDVVSVGDEDEQVSGDDVEDTRNSVETDQIDEEAIDELEVDEIETLPDEETADLGSDELLDDEPEDVELQIESDDELPDVHESDAHLEGDVDLETSDEELVPVAEVATEESLDDDLDFDDDFSWDDLDEEL